MSYLLPSTVSFSLFAPVLQDAKKGNVDWNQITFRFTEIFLQYKNLMMHNIYQLNILLLALVLFHSRPSQGISDAQPFYEPALACLCQALDKESSVKQNSSLLQSECLDGYHLFLSTYTVFGSTTSIDTSCTDILQLVPQDYCGYPEVPEPFSLEKPPEICSPTNDKEKCSFETYLQPNTPCHWAEGRPCYWDTSIGECQGILTPWFTKTYGLSSNVTHICSKQRTKSSCRNTYMLGGHCTSWTIEGEDSNRVCASQLDKLACVETTFSALRACIWQEKKIGWEAFFSSCCNIPPYQRPLAGSAWCANIGMNYVADGRISANIGESTCDDIAGTYVRYHQSREIYLDLFGSAFVSTVDEACCRPSIISSPFPTLSPILTPKMIPPAPVSLLEPSVMWKVPFNQPYLTSGQKFIPAHLEGINDPVQSVSPSKFLSLPAQAKQPTSIPIKNPIIMKKKPIFGTYYSVIPVYQPTEYPSFMPRSVPFTNDIISVPSAQKIEAGLPQNTFHPSFRHLTKTTLPAAAPAFQKPITSMQPSAWNYPNIAHEVPLRSSNLSTRPVNKPSAAPINHSSLSPTKAILNRNATEAPSTHRNKSDVPINASNPSIGRLPSAWSSVTQYPLQYPRDNVPTQSAYSSMRPSNKPVATVIDYPIKIPLMAPLKRNATKKPSANRIETSLPLEVYHPSFHQTFKPSQTNKTKGKPSKLKSAPPMEHSTSNYPTRFPSVYQNINTNTPTLSSDSAMTPNSALPSTSTSYGSANSEKMRIDRKEGGKAKVGAAAAALLALPLIGFLGYKRRNAPQDGGNDVKLDDI